MNSETKIICISFPNSGNHWLSGLCTTLEIPWQHAHMGATHTSVPRKFSEIVTSYTLYPWIEQLREINVILLHRDPKDTIVSSYCHSKYRKRPSLSYKSSLQEFIRDPGFGIEKCIQFNLYWREYIRSPYLITYEQLSQDTASTLAKLCTHYNIDISMETISNSVQKNNFEVKQQQELAIRGIDANKESLKARRGVVGGFKNYMSDADIEFCDKMLTSTNYYQRML
jgi:hypothetical protein